MTWSNCKLSETSLLRPATGPIVVRALFDATLRLVRFVSPAMTVTEVRFDCRRSSVVSVASVEIGATFVSGLFPIQSCVSFGRPESGVIVAT